MIGADRSAAILRIRRCLEDDPCTAWYLVLLAELFDDLNDVVIELAEICNDDSVHDRLASLETRYSEVLYHLKGKLE